MIVTTVHGCTHVREHSGVINRFNAFIATLLVIMMGFCLLALEEPATMGTEEELITVNAPPDTRTA